MLAGQEVQRLVRLQRQHRDARAACFGPGHGGHPPRRGVLGVPAGGLGHDLRGVIERRLPRRLSSVVPSLTGETVQCSQQRAAEHLEMLFPDTVLAVPAAEPLQVRHEAGRIVLASGYPGQGMEQTPALQVHCGREHRGDLGVHREKLTIEISHRRVGGRLKQGE
jgi:hypothetical protein